MDRAQQLIDKVTAHPGDGDAVNALLAEFHKGYPLGHLLPLLQSPDGDVADAGTWIASELGTKGRPLLAYVVPLLHHPNKKVRFWAIDCILCWAGPADVAGITGVLPLLDDGEYAVRWKAMGFLSRLSDANLQAALDHLKSAEPHSRYLVSLEWLISGAADDPEEVASFLRSENPVFRKFAAAAASRMAAAHDGPLALAATHEDSDIRKFASDMQGTK